MWYNYKKVTFNKIIEVYIIPSFFTNIDKLNLWWNKNDVNNAVFSCKTEIANLIEIHPQMEIKYARKLLYQPNNISYDPNNF
jgi:hypothetical protein